MVFDWFGKPKEPESVSDLVARRKYDRALELLREHFEAGRRDIDLRLQYADVLVYDERPAEALPILLGVADELLAKGENKRTQEVLARLEEIEPGHPETATRWDALATLPADGDESAGASADTPSDAPDEPSPGPVPEWTAGPETAAAAEAPAFEPGELRSPVEESAAPPAEAADEPLPAREPPPDVAPRDDSAVVVDAIWCDGEEEPDSHEPEPPPFRAEDPAPASQFIAPDDWDEDLATADGEGVVDWVETLLGRLPSADGARFRPGPLLAALFDGVTRGEIREMAAGLHHRSLAPGDVAVTEGEKGTSLYVLTGGRARVSVRSPSGHCFPLADLGPGEFFGEVAALSGRARCATVTALCAAEALEIDRPALDRLTRRNARAKGMLENVCVERALSPDAAAVRAVPADATPEHADRILTGFFGLRRASPRLRLRLASALLKAGNDRQVLPVLAELAEELAAAGQSRKGLAILRRIERLAHRDIQELCLAPLEREKLDEPPASGEEHRPQPAPATGRSRRPAMFQDRFQSWLHHVTREEPSREAV